MWHKAGSTLKITSISHHDTISSTMLAWCQEFVNSCSTAIYVDLSYQVLPRLGIIKVGEMGIHLHSQVRYSKILLMWLTWYWTHVTLQNVPDLKLYAMTMLLLMTHSLLDAKLIKLDHPLYSPALAPHSFWLFPEVWRATDFQTLPTF